AGTLEGLLEVRTVQAEAKATGLRDDLGFARGGDDRRELAARLVVAPGGDEDAGQVQARRRGAARAHGALERRARGLEITSSESEDPQELLRAGEQGARRADRAEVRRGARACPAGEVQLREREDVLVPERMEGMRVLEREDRAAGLAHLPAELAEKVMGAPRAGAELEQLLQGPRAVRLFAPLHGLRRQDQEALLRGGALGVDPQGGEVGLLGPPELAGG